MSIVEILFYAFSAVLVVAAVGVITARNPVHCALFLVWAFFNSAVIWLLLEAEFLAIVLMLVYVGAVMVLFLFGIMLTRAQLGVERDLNNRYWGAAIPVALMLVVVLSWAILDAFDDQTMPDPGGPTPTQAIADNVLSNSLVPFLALSFILLAAAVGAIVLARKD